MQFLSNEKELSSLGSVTLTNLRVIEEIQNRFGYKNNKIIFLEDISFIEPEYRNPFWLLILGALFIPFAIYLKFNGGNMFYFPAAFCALLWWFFLEYNINVTSNSGKDISFNVKQLNKNKIEDFITEIQEAKLNRVNELHNKP